MKRRFQMVSFWLAVLLALSGCSTPGQPEQTTAPTQPIGDLICVEISRFSGGFVEDGSDEKVTDVAAILVSNETGKFVDLATVTYTVGEKTATFRITGLPAGERVWVLEKDRLQLSEGDKLVFDECKVTYKEDPIRSTQSLAVTREGNTLTVTNVSEHTLNNVCVYYKNRLEDGSFFGGITYLINFGRMEPGETMQRSADHFGEKSTVVRYSFQESE